MRKSLKKFYWVLGMRMVSVQNLVHGTKLQVVNTDSDGVTF